MYVPVDMHEVVPRLVETLASPTKVSHEFGHKPATETLLYPLLTYDPKKGILKRVMYLISNFQKTLRDKQKSGLYSK